jgi:hypothetical protein
MVRLIRSDDKDVSESEIQLYLLVVDVADRFGVEPSMSQESEDYFVRMLDDFLGDPTDLQQWLEERIAHAFVSLGERPRWIQGAQWPFAEGQPMIFAGQMELAPQQGGIAEQLFHDATSLYVFLAPKVEPVVVMQQM